MIKAYAEGGNSARRGLNAPNSTQPKGIENGFKVTRYPQTNSGNKRKQSGGTNAGNTRQRG